MGHVGLVLISASGCMFTYSDANSDSRVYLFCILNVNLLRWGYRTLYIGQGSQG